MGALITKPHVSCQSLENTVADTKSIVHLEKRLGFGCAGAAPALPMLDKYSVAKLAP